MIELLAYIIFAWFVGVVMILAFKYILGDKT